MSESSAPELVIVSDGEVYSSLKAESFVDNDNQLMSSEVKPDKESCCSETLTETDSLEDDCMDPSEKIAGLAGDTPHLPDAEDPLNILNNLQLTDKVNDFNRIDSEEVSNADSKMDAKQVDVADESEVSENSEVEPNDNDNNNNPDTPLCLEVIDESDELLDTEENLEAETSEPIVDDEILQELHFISEMEETLQSEERCWKNTTAVDEGEASTENVFHEELVGANDLDCVHLIQSTGKVQNSKTPDSFDAAERENDGSDESNDDEGREVAESDPDSSNKNLDEAELMEKSDNDEEMDGKAREGLCGDDLIDGEELDRFEEFEEEIEKLNLDDGLNIDTAEKSKENQELQVKHSPSLPPTAPQTARRFLRSPKTNKASSAVGKHQRSKIVRQCSLPTTSKQVKKQGSLPPPRQKPSSKIARPSTKEDSSTAETCQGSLTTRTSLEPVGIRRSSLPNQERRRGGCTTWGGTVVPEPAFREVVHPLSSDTSSSGSGTNVDPLQETAAALQKPKLMKKRTSIDSTPMQYKETNTTMKRREQLVARNNAVLQKVKDEAYTTPLQRKEAELRELRSQLSETVAVVCKREQALDEFISERDRETSERIAEYEGRRVSIEVEIDRVTTEMDEQENEEKRDIFTIKEMEDLLDTKREEYIIREKQQEEMYLEIHNKGKHSAMFEREIELEKFAVEDPSEVSTLELVDKLISAGNQLKHWQRVKLAEHYTEVSLPGSDIEAKLRFMKDSMFHFLTESKRDESQQHMRALVDMFGFSDVQLKVINKNLEDRRKHGKM